MSDPASLDRLNDIVQPDAVNWWPPAPAWYVLAVLLGIFLAALAWRGWKKWRRNRYRRQALRELASISRTDDPKALVLLPALLKRAALCAWPRSLVASLSGSQWHEFLDRTGGGREFTSGAGQVLDRLAYGLPEFEPTSVTDRAIVLKATEHWLRRHDADNKVV